MNLLQMSLSGAGLILLIALLRPALLRTVPKRTFLILWGLVLLRLLIPFPGLLRLPALLPESLLAPITATAAPVPTAAPAPLPMETAAPAGSVQATPRPARTPAVTPAPDAAPAPDGPVMPAAPAETVSPEAPDFSPGIAPAPRIALLGWIWRIGCCLTAAVFLLLYALSYRRFRRAVPAEGAAAAAWLQGHPTRRKLRLRTLPDLASPLTYGILRPVILLPEGLDWADGATVFALEHEYVHARRLDALWKLLLTAALVLHWFNPFVWLMWLLANRDLELSCDEEVLRRFGADSRGDYARALLAMEEKRRIAPAVSAGFGADTTRARITAIMKYRKKTALSVALGLAMVLVLAACALGGRGAAKTSPGQPGPDLTVGPIRWGMSETEARRALRGAKAAEDGSLVLKADFCGVPAELRWEFAGDESGRFLNGMSIVFDDDEAGSRRRAITEALEAAWGPQVESMPAIWPLELPGLDGTELAPEEDWYWRTEDCSDEWKWKSGVTARFPKGEDRPTLRIDASGRNLAEGRLALLPQTIETQLEVTRLLGVLRAVHPTARTWGSWPPFAAEKLRLDDYYHLRLYTEEDLALARRCFAPYPWVTMEYPGDQYEPADISGILLDGSLTPVKAAVSRDRLREELRAVFVNRTEETANLSHPVRIYAERPEGWVQPKLIEVGFVDYVTETVEPGGSLILNWDYVLTYSAYDFVPGRYLLAVGPFGAMVTITEEGASSPADDGERVRFQNGAYVLTLPAARAEQLTVEAPEEEELLFRVWEKDARALGDGREDGLLFSIRRLEGGYWISWLAETTGGAFCFARECGDDFYSDAYYLIEYPPASDARDGRDASPGEEDYYRWALAAWGEDAAARFIGDNAGLGLLPFRFTEAARLLAQVLRSPGYDSIRQGDGVRYDNLIRPATIQPLLRLLREADYRETAPTDLPAGEPIVLETPEGASLRFWPGSDLAVLDRDGERRFFLGTCRDGSSAVGDLAYDLLTAAMKPQNTLGYICRRLEELPELCTDILVGTYTGSRRDQFVREDDFTVKRVLKGTTAEGPIAVYTDIVSAYTLEPATSYITGQLAYEAGQDYLLLLRRYRSVFYDADHYSLFYEAFLPLSGAQAASMYGEPLEKHSEALRADSTGEEMLDHLQALIDADEGNSPEFYGTGFVEASSPEEAMEAAPFVLWVEVTGQISKGRDGVGQDGREVCACRVTETVKGDLGSLGSSITVLFPSGTAEQGAEYRVCVTQVDRPNSLLFVPISRKYSIHRLGETEN